LQLICNITIKVEKNKTASEGCWEDLEEGGKDELVEGIYRSVRGAFKNGESAWIHHTVPVSFHSLCEISKKCMKNEVQILTTGALVEPLIIKIRGNDKCTNKLLHEIVFRVFMFFVTKTDFRSVYKGKKKRQHTDL
jgi:hypothetical protein